MGDRFASWTADVCSRSATPLEVYERPANLFVARFIGQPKMNLLPATLDGGALTVAGRRLGFEGPRALGRPLLAGFRAERASAVAKESATDGTLPFTVDFVEQLGHETLAHGRIEGAAEPVVVRFAPPRGAAGGRRARARGRSRRLAPVRRRLGRPHGVAPKPKAGEAAGLPVRLVGRRLRRGERLQGRSRLDRRRRVALRALGRERGERIVVRAASTSR